jgi:hypothetical protein
MSLECAGRAFFKGRRMSASSPVPSAHGRKEKTPWPSIKLWTAYAAGQILAVHAFLAPFATRQNVSVLY